MTIDEELQDYIKKMAGKYDGNGHGIFFNVAVEQLNRETLLEIIRFMIFEQERKIKFDKHTADFLDEIDAHISK